MMKFVRAQMDFSEKKLHTFRNKLL